MLCPRCGWTSSRVLETRTRHGAIRRRRQCARCSHVCWTIEAVEWRVKVNRRIADGVRIAKRKGEAYARDMKIVQAVKDGRLKADVAADFGVATSTVSYVLGKYAPELKGYRARTVNRKPTSVFDWRLR